MQLGGEGSKFLSAMSTNITLLLIILNLQKTHKGLQSYLSMWTFISWIPTMLTLTQNSFGKKRVFIYCADWVSFCDRKLALTLWYSVFLEYVIVIHLVKIILVFTKCKSSSPHSKNLTEPSVESFLIFTTYFR